MNDDNQYDDPNVAYEESRFSDITTTISTIVGTNKEEPMQEIDNEIAAVQKSITDFAENRQIELRELRQKAMDAKVAANCSTTAVQKAILTILTIGRPGTSLFNILASIPNLPARNAAAKS